MGAPSMKFKPFFLSLLIIVFCAAFASAQHLPDMPVKPTPQFESPSFCPPEGRESCNCDSTQPAQIDFHIWLLFAANDNRKDAIVVEMTPRVREHHPTWTVDMLTSIANQKLPVRISGWLMYDGQHPEQLPPGSPAQPPTRATLWEIHPIMKVEFKQNGVWKTL